MDPLLALTYVALPIAMIVLLSVWGGRPFWRLAASRAQWVGAILWTVFFFALWQVRLSFALQILILVAIGLVIAIWNRKRTPAT